MSTIPAYLRTMFTDERWELIHERIYYGEIDGQKNGVVLAIQPPNRDKYAWNCDERERVLNARLTGKIDLAFGSPPSSTASESRPSTNAATSLRQCPRPAFAK
jgi:hypothetical protein